MSFIVNYYLLGVLVAVGMHFWSDNKEKRPLSKAWKQAMSEDRKESAGALIFLMAWPLWTPIVMAKSIGQALRQVIKRDK